MTEVISETDYEIGGAELAAFTDHVLTGMHVVTDTELNILFIDPEPMENLHIHRPDLPDPADVMSFPMDELHPRTADRPASMGILGDICICPQITEQQAKGTGHATMEEMLIFATHGISHLLSYDHAGRDEKKEMFTLQHTPLLAFLAT